jgi:hypothetical protein
MMKFLRIDLFVTSTRLNLPSPSSPSFSILIMTTSRCKIEAVKSKQQHQTKLVYFVKIVNKIMRNSSICSACPRSIRRTTLGWYHFRFRHERSRKKNKMQKCKARTQKQTQNVPSRPRHKYKQASGKEGGGGTLSLVLQHDVLAVFVQPRPLFGLSGIVNSFSASHGQNVEVGGVRSAIAAS